MAVARGSFHGSVAALSVRGRSGERGVCVVGGSSATAFLFVDPFDGSTSPLLSTPGRAFVLRDKRHVGLSLALSQFVLESWRCENSKAATISLANSCAL